MSPEETGQVVEVLLVHKWAPHMRGQGDSEERGRPLRIDRWPRKPAA